MDVVEAAMLPQKEVLQWSMTDKELGLLSLVPRVLQLEATVLPHVAFEVGAPFQTLALRFAQHALSRCASSSSFNFMLFP